jgi:hypothetical protein
VYDVVPISTGSLDKKVFDQSGNKFSRYVMFIFNEMLIAWSTLRQGRREGISAVFAEGTYYSLAGGMAAKVLGVPMIWDNHGNIKDFATTLGKSRFFLHGNLALERLLVRLASKVLVVSGNEVEAYGPLVSTPLSSRSCPPARTSPWSIPGCGAGRRPARSWASLTTPRSSCSSAH